MTPSKSIRPKVKTTPLSTYRRSQQAKKREPQRKDWVQ